MIGQQQLLDAVFAARTKMPALEIKKYSPKDDYLIVISHEWDVFYSRPQYWVEIIHKKRGLVQSKEFVEAYNSKLWGRWASDWIKGDIFIQQKEGVSDFPDYDISG